MSPSMQDQCARPEPSDHKTLSITSDSPERALPRVDTYSENILLSRLSQELAIVVLGLESEEAGRVLSAEKVARQTYPDIPVVMLQQYREGNETTTFLFACEQQHFQSVMFVLISDMITVTTNAGLETEDGYVISFDDPISQKTLYKVMETLKERPSLEFRKLEAPKGFRD